MGDFAKSSNDDTPASALREQAKEALDRGELDFAEELLRKAVKLLEEAGEDEASKAYSGLGIIAGRRRDLDAADEWYRKSLEIDERSGNECGAAKTYHNLSLVAIDRRDFEAAEKWLRKSIHIAGEAGRRNRRLGKLPAIGVGRLPARRPRHCRQVLSEITGNR